MISKRARIVVAAAVAIVLVLAAGAVALAVWLRPRPIPDTFEPVGPFEIVTHTHRYTGGWNEGRLYRGTTESYSLRYRGAPFAFEGRAGMFGDETARYERINAIVTFPSRQPAIVANVGDPNNSSFFYLVRERDGAAVAEYLGDSSGGVSADWLDPRPGAAPASRALAVHRAHLEGGRFLLLGQYTILDTETLESFRFEQHRGASLNEFKPPIAVSPDGRSFVRWATDDANDAVLVVFDFVAGTSYALPVDRRVMRYNSWEEVDAAWLDHYFEWKAAKGTSDRLAPRERVTPLPYHGALTRDVDGYREYRVVKVTPEMYDVILEFLAREYGAAVLPREQYSSTDRLAIGDREVHVGFFEDHVGVWMDRGTDARLVEELGARFDVELATGRHDALFLP